VPYSELNYLRPAQLTDYVHSIGSVTDEALAAKFIGDAERLVDIYVGPGPRFHRDVSTLETSALLTSGSTALLTDSLGGSARPNYWARGGMYVTVRDAGPAVDQSRLVVASEPGSLTLASGFDADLPAGTAMLIEQWSAFPRVWDRDANGDPQLPDELARAVAYQVEYAMHFGTPELGLGAPGAVTDTGGVQSRMYGTGYSETRSVLTPVTGLGVLIAPKARAILRRLINATGKLQG
jgi:hypothetical protein